MNQIVAAVLLLLCSNVFMTFAWYAHATVNHFRTALTLMLPTAARLLALVAIVSLTACTGRPDTVEPVTGFELERYLGKWYEIARLDHSFERGLSRVTAEYSLRDDGGVKVVNAGYAAADNEWQDVVGRAYFVESPDTAYLKVSFFGPFYGSYIVFGLDREDYSYAFVSGPTLDYLWLLSRTPQVDPAIVEEFVQAARARGFATDRLIYTVQE